MKINVNQIPAGGLIIEESISAGELELETEEFKFVAPIKIKGKVFGITNAISVDLTISGQVITQCSLCLSEARIDINKKVSLNYQVSGQEKIIDLGPDIREEVILEYPFKPLCKEGCRGLCPQCGKVINQGGCSCGTT